MNRPSPGSRPTGMPPRLSAGVVVVRHTREGWRVLLLRCYDHWDFPKGGVKPGETPLAAARRETREESGMDALHFRWGEVWCETAPYQRPPKVARYYLAETRKTEIHRSVSKRLGRPEHDEGRWVDFDAAHCLLQPRLHPILAWARALVEGAPDHTEA